MMPGQENVARPGHGSASHADAIVIGAGIVGAACAWRLAQRGLNVVVVERESAPATGSTGRSAAGVRHQFSEPVNVALSRESIAEYRAMPEAGFSPIGYLFLVPKDQWDAQLRDVSMQRSLGAPIELLSLEQANARVPLSGEGLRGATWCPADGVVDPHGICLAYVGRARSLGARFLFGHRVDAISRSGGRWHLACGDTRLSAPMLVNAGGAWSGQIAALAGLDVPVRPARRMVFTTGPLEASLRQPQPYPLTIDLGNGFWFRSERDRLIFGLANPEDTGFEEGIDWAWLETAWTAALAHFPWFERVTIDRRACWWGYYEVTPDHNPVIGRMPDAPGWINACGFSGHGVQHAAAVGRVVAEEACDEQPFIDIDALRIERFAGERTDLSGGERLVV